MNCRERLEQWFAAAGVPYEVVTHPPAYTAQQVASLEHRSGYEVAKVVMAAVDGKLVMLVLPAPHRVDLVKLRTALEARTTRLAEEEEFANIFPDCETGAMPPFGNLYGITVYADPALAGDPHLTFNAGTHRETMTISYGDFARLAQPRILDFSTPPVGVR